MVGCADVVCSNIPGDELSKRRKRRRSNWRYNQEQRDPRLKRVTRYLRRRWYVEGEGNANAIESEQSALTTGSSVDRRELSSVMLSGNQARGHFHR